MKKRVAISIGDLNGIGLELALINHKNISQIVEPIYFIDRDLLELGSDLLKIEIPKSLKNINGIGKNFNIEAGKVSAESGLYSFNSFKSAVESAKNGDVFGISTLPINKESWKLAGIKYSGHTSALRHFFNQKAIMVMGANDLWVALYTEHISLSEIPKFVKREFLEPFLRIIWLEFKNKFNKIAVLALNPHGGDGGVCGNDEVEIEQAVLNINREIGFDFFSRPLVPDIAFTPRMRNEFKFYISMYHDQGLIPLKTLYFDESINISINLPILRTSVGHGTAFDIAYKNNRILNSKSYINSIVWLANK
jgi:4-hydroxythreonine-4-phosphate dehydrogenase